MNTRTTLFLVVLVALLGGFVVWDHHKGRSTKERKEKDKRILDFEAKNVTHIDLVRSNQTIVLDKTGDNWGMEQPLVGRADDGAVNSILAELEFAEHIRILTGKELEGVSLSDFGLDAPRIRITLHSKKRPIGLLIGSETPTRDALYAQVEGRKEVYVTRLSVQERLSQTVENLRSRTAIEFTPSSTTRIEIKVADRVIELAKPSAVTNTESRWTLTRPLVTRADQSKVSELLTDLTGLRVHDFVSEDPKDLHTYLLDEPEREVTVFGGDDGKTIVFGKSPTNDPSKVYAKLKSGNSIVTVSADAAKKFAAQINDLRDTRVYVLRSADVTGIEIIHGTDKIALNRAEKGWHLTAPLAVPAEDPAVNQFLDDLGNLRAREFTADVTTDLDKYGLATPATTVSLFGEETNTLAQLLVGSLDASNAVRYVKRADEPFIYGIEPATLNRIPGHYGALRTRRVFDLRPEHVTKLVAGTVTLERDTQGRWKLVEPPQGALDNDSVQHLLEAFCQLRAEEFGRVKTHPDAGLGTTIKATVGDTTHWLSIAPDRQAAADACELTFTLSAPVVQTLTKGLVAVPKTEVSTPPVSAPVTTNAPTTPAN